MTLPQKPRFSALFAALMCTCLAMSLLAKPKDPGTIAMEIAAQMKCPDAAKWKRIADNRPLKGCGDLSLEEGCQLSDGRKHGPWIVYEKRMQCRKPASIRHYKEGRQHGKEQLFVLVCAGKKGKETCRSVASEAGPYRDDKRHGLWVKFKDNGGKLEEGSYFEGTRQGPWTTFASNGRPKQVTCFADGKQTWQATPSQVATKAMPCAVTREKKKEQEFAAVSENDAKASKLARLALSTPKMALRVRYLQKAVSLCPNNDRYKRLLATAQEEAKKTP